MNAQIYNGLNADPKTRKPSYWKDGPGQGEGGHRQLRTGGMMPGKLRLEMNQGG